MPLKQYSEKFPELCERLLRARELDRIAHAYLFVGDQTELLEKFAAQWIQVCACEKNGPNAQNRDACGTCDPCRLLENDAYPELYKVKPQSKSRRIRIDDIRDLEHQLSLTADRGRLKIAFVSDADCMGKEAQNAFLKTLEEPMPGTLIVLLTTKPRRLLNTIRSRCQRISIIQNQRSYRMAITGGLFQILSKLRGNAGAAVALEQSEKLADIFAGLHEKAEKTVAELRDDSWEELIETDSTLEKKLADEEKAKVEAHYAGLRQNITDAISVWFQQQSLRAAGVRDAALPHPEILEAAGKPPPPPSSHLADEALTFTEELLYCLATNANERLAIDTFCLSVTQKKST